MATRTNGGIYNNTNVWAENGQKDEPTFTETDGWDITYSQAGGNAVERTLMNRNFNKASAALYDVNRFGANLAWSSVVNYEIGAKVIGSDNKVYKSKTTNNNIDPVSDNGTNWKYDEKPLSSDANINIVEDARGNTSFSLTSNLSDKANKTLDNVTVGDFLGKFDNSNNITWAASAGKIKANYIQPIIYANNTSITLSASDSGKEIIASATTTNTVINLPDMATVPDDWQIKLTILTVQYGVYPTTPYWIEIKTQGTNPLVRNNTTLGTSYKIRSSNSVLYIRKVQNPAYAIEGILRNEWAANCTYNNIDFPTEGGLADVVLTERADDKLCDLNFTILAGPVGFDPTWSTVNGHYCKAFVIDFAPLNNLIDKYTTSISIRGYTCTPIIDTDNFEDGRKGTAVTTSVSYVRTFGTAGNQTNQIQVAVQSPTTARTKDSIVLNVQLTFQNWVKRG